MTAFKPGHIYLKGDVDRLDFRGVPWDDVVACARKRLAGMTRPMDAAAYDEDGSVTSSPPGSPPQSVG